MVRAKSNTNRYSDVAFKMLRAGMYYGGRLLQRVSGGSLGKRPFRTIVMGPVNIKTCEEFETYLWRHGALLNLSDLPAYRASLRQKYLREVLSETQETLVPVPSQ